MNWNIIIGDMAVANLRAYDIPDEPTSLDDVHVHEWEETVHDADGGVIETEECKTCGVAYDPAND